jgi:hypothetical protein
MFGWLTLLTIPMWLAIGSGRVSAQGAFSDTLFEVILDQNGHTVGVPGFFGLPESAENGMPITLTVASLTIDFQHGPGMPLNSDRFHFNPYTVTILSDDERPGGLPRRPNAVPIMSTAEGFTIWSTRAFSDNDPPAVGGVSDLLTATLTGSAPVTMEIVEPASETTPEPLLTITLPARMFDLINPDEPGVSDYVDIGAITITFLSSDDQTLYTGVPDGVVLEGPIGGQLTYSLVFTSDAVVPEPSSILLLASGAGIAVFRGWRRRVLGNRR